jgi:nucleotide-binding universal stress UspA family protein
MRCWTRFYDYNWLFDSIVPRVKSMKILLAVDDSEYSALAAREVAKRPWPRGATVRVLTVAEPFPPIAMEPWYGGRESLIHIGKEVKQGAQDLANKTAESLKKKGIKTQAVVLEGDPRFRIVDEADRWAADLIVMGSHGYTGIKRLLLGSVASSVVGHAPCSVEIVRRKKKKSGSGVIHANTSTNK